MDYESLLTQECGLKYDIEINQTAQVIHANDGNAYYKFTPNKSGLHRLFTENNQAAIVRLFDDPGLHRQIGSDGQTIEIHGVYFNKMEANLRVNQTYYVQVLNSSSAVTFLTVEEARQSNRETAEAISFDQVYDFDLTSVFDNFYYKFKVAESTQMSVNFTEGLVTLEDQEKNIVTTFESDQEDHVFIPVETGTYYIKLNYDPNDTISTTMARSNIRSIQPFSSLKKGQVSIKVLNRFPHVQSYQCASRT